jgi:hypothetical protein
MEAVSVNMYDQSGNIVGGVSFFNIDYPAHPNKNLGYCLNSIKYHSDNLSLEAGAIIKNNEGNIFHGISGMDFNNNNLVMVADWGVTKLYEIEPLYSDTTAFSGIELKTYSSMIHLDGRIITEKEFDAEEIAIIKGNKAFISTEKTTDESTNQTIEHDSIYQIDLTNMQFIRKIETPQEFATLTSNGGIEAFSVLNTDNHERFLAIEEGSYNAENVRMFIWDDIDAHLQNQQIIQYTPECGLNPVSATFLSHNELLVLERGSKGWSVGKRAEFTTALKYVKLKDDLECIEFEEIKLLATIDPDSYCENGIPLNDNFESIAARKLDSGGYDIFIISDDNLSDFQDNILLQFHFEI